MGVYIYTLRRTGKEGVELPTGEVVFPNPYKYAFKPWLRGFLSEYCDAFRREDLMMGRAEAAWKGKEMPEYVTASEFAPCARLLKVKGYVPAVRDDYDDPPNTELVGYLVPVSAPDYKKRKVKWVVVEDRESAEEICRRIEARAKAELKEGECPAYADGILRPPCKSTDITILPGTVKVGSNALYKCNTCGNLWERKVAA